MRDVDQVLILAVGLLQTRLDGDAVLLGVGQHVAAALELGEPLGVLPRGDDLHVAHVHVVAELEADLVVPLARGSMRHVLRAFLLRDLYVALGDDGAGEAGAEHVCALVDGVGLERREYVVRHQRLLQVLDVDLAGTCGIGLLLDRLEVLVLSDVRHVCDDVEALVAQPLQDDGGVESSGVCKNDLLF